jgi:thiamine biosynthesis lipoprotein
VALAPLGCPEVKTARPSPEQPGDAANGKPPSPTEPEPEDTDEIIPGLQVELAGKAMGTRVALAAFTTEELNVRAVRRALQAALDEILRVEKEMSTWVKTSDVSRINAAAGGAPVAVSHETLAVISKSLWISELSEGTFDISFASMGKLWQFDEKVSRVVPDPADVSAARAKIDYRKIKVDEANKTVQLESKDTVINLGGIAKGYAIDRAAAVLRDKGITSFFAQAGGDLFVEGLKPDGRGWNVGIRDPRGPDGSYFAVVEVTDHAFSTSGDYERFFIKDGKRYHHIIDPRTGYPATASRSVTIWAKDALTADALDNAVFILGPEKGLALVESLDECGAVIVDANNNVHISKRLEGKVTIRRSPSEGL